MPDPTLLVLVAGAAVAGFVQGLSGFAFGLTASSIWVWWLPPQWVAVMAVFGALTGQVIAALTVRRAAGWPRLWPLLVGAAAGLPLGLWLLPRLDADGFRLGVGLLLAVWCPLMLVSHRLPVLIFASLLATGVVTRAMWPAFAWMAPALLIPVLLGARLYTGISPAAFRRVVLTLLALSGAALLVRAVPALLARAA